MSDFVIPEKPCARCSRFVGHADWCPERLDVWCICSDNRPMEQHRYGDSFRCLYVADSAWPDRPHRGWLTEQLSVPGVDVQKCHWPAPTRGDIVLRQPECPHGQHPFELMK